eukprot:GHVP01068201.1.p1 GENE.GHVP01068201.1~~GHVP01068201.1.p1  ORF type:complete len:119 (+),score=6.87 GHVP01068201.1:82-438(+)
MNPQWMNRRKSLSWIPSRFRKWFSTTSGQDSTNNSFRRAVPTAFSLLRRLAILTYAPNCLESSVCISSTDSWRFGDKNFFSNILISALLRNKAAANTSASSPPKIFLTACFEKGSPPL